MSQSRTPPPYQLSSCHNYRIILFVEHLIRLKFADASHRVSVTIRCVVLANIRFVSAHFCRAFLSFRAILISYFSPPIRRSETGTIAFYFLNENCQCIIILFFFLFFFLNLYMEKSRFNICPSFIVLSISSHLQ